MAVMLTRRERVGKEREVAMERARKAATAKGGRH
jgi:hypothetical protein